MLTYHDATMKNGSRLSVFFNSETNLLVVDVVDAQERGGNEVVRMTLDEGKLLSFLDGDGKKSVK